MNTGAIGGCPDLLRTMTLRRRDLLEVGGVGLMSGGLLSILSARARAGAATRGKARACIVLFQVGGPYQCDTFDPKPEAPEEVRGPFKVIATAAPGLSVTEALPRVAAHAEKLAV